MITTQQYVKGKIANDILPTELSDIIGVSQAMISKYKNEGYNASLAGAMNVYQYDGTVLHPYSEESLQKEIENDKNRITRTN